MESKSDGLKKRITDLFHFASLHGWCRDVDDEMNKICAAIEPDKMEKISGELLNNLQKNDKTKVEQILSIALLHKLDYPSFDLSDKLYKSLFNQIYDNDFVFLINHLFENRYPFPADIINNMIRRDYLSYSLAINEAFLINSIVSEISPDDAVLYLTVLLCHKSLNDQNKAMLYFLLSRIDTELPRELFLETMKYIYRLKPVITAIEKDPESALSKSLDLKTELNQLSDDSVVSFDEDIKDSFTSVDPVLPPSSKIDQAVTEVQKTGKSNNQSGHESIKVESERAINLDIEMIDQAEPAISEPLPLNIVKRESFFPEKKVVEENSLELKEDDQLSPISLRESRVEADITGDQKSEIPDGTDKTIEIDRKESKASFVEGKSPLQTVSGGEEVVSGDDNPVVEETSTYEITFSKSLEEILRMAEKFGQVNPEEIKKTQRKVFKKPNQYDMEVLERDEPAVVDTDDKKREEQIPVESIPQVGKPKKKPQLKMFGPLKKAISILGFVFIGIMAAFVIGRAKRDEKPASSDVKLVGEQVVPSVAGETVDDQSLEPLAEASETEDKPLRESPAEANVTGEVQTAQTDFTVQDSVEYITASGDKFTFVFDGEEISLKVNERNSFDKLYLFLSADNPVENGEIKSLGELSWDDFIGQILRLNRGIDNPHLIYPGDSFVLIDNR